MHKFNYKSTHKVTKKLYSNFIQFFYFSLSVYFFFKKIKNKIVKFNLINK